MSKCRKVVDTVSATALEDFLRTIHVNGVPLERSLPAKIKELKFSDEEADDMFRNLAPSKKRGTFVAQTAAELDRKLDEVLKRLEKPAK